MFALLVPTVLLDRRWPLSFCRISPPTLCALPPFMQNNMHMQMNSKPLPSPSRHSFRCTSIACTSQTQGIHDRRLMRKWPEPNFVYYTFLSHSFCAASQWFGHSLNMLGPLWPSFVVLPSCYHSFSEQTMGSVDAGHGGHVLFADVHYLPIPSFCCPCSVSVPCSE